MAIERFEQTNRSAEPVESALTLEESLEKGYWGYKYDPRPNEDYTMQGAVARSNELFENGEETAEAKRRGPGRPRKDETR